MNKLQKLVLVLTFALLFISLLVMGWVFFLFKWGGAYMGPSPSLEPLICIRDIGEDDLDIVDDLFSQNRLESVPKKWLHIADNGTFSEKRIIYFSKPIEEMYSMVFGEEKACVYLIYSPTIKEHWLKQHEIPWKHKERIRKRIEQDIELLLKNYKDSLPKNKFLW